MNEFVPSGSEEDLASIKRHNPRKTEGERGDEIISDRPPLEGKGGRGEAFERRGSQSLDRNMSLDNQYVQVMSPERKTKSMKAYSTVTRCAEPSAAPVDSRTSELNYVNLPADLKHREARSKAKSLSTDNSVAVCSVRDQRSPVRGSKSPCPSPRSGGSPKPQPKPRPHPSSIPPANSRSKTAGSVPVTSPVNGGVACKGNGSLIGNGTHGSSDNRIRSSTSPMNGSVHRNDRGYGGEEEVLYVNVESDVGVEDLYQNI